MHRIPEGSNRNRHSNFLVSMLVTFLFFSLDFSPILSLSIPSHPIPSHRFPSLFLPVLPSVFFVCACPVALQHLGSLHLPFNLNYLASVLSFLFLCDNELLSGISGNDGVYQVLVYV